MSPRFTPTAALALVVLPLFAAPLHAQGVAYLPGTARYHVTLTTHGTQTSPVGSQAFDLGAEERLTVAIAGQARDTLRVTSTIDALTLRSSGPMPDVSKYQGIVFTTLMSPTGGVYSTKGPEGADVLLSQLTESVSHFLPTWRRDLRPGLAWSDTTTGKVTQQGMQVDRTVVTDYAVRGDTVIGGARAVLLRRHTVTKAAGSGGTGAGQVTLQSSTTSDADFYLARTGEYLGGHGNDDIEVRLTLVSQSAEVTIRQQAAQVITRLP